VRFALPVRETQAVRVVVYDLLGREVAVPLDGVIPAHTERSIRLAEQLAPGAYFVRVTGERFVTTERMTVVQ
jgi:uncharacterized protein (DUF427 family)